MTQSVDGPSRGSHGRREAFWAACVALGFVIAGVVLVSKPDLDLGSPTRGDSDFYLSMVARRWLNGRPGWTPGLVPSPYGYRVLAPWLARVLPFDPVRSLGLVTYGSLAGAYTFILLSGARLGLSRMAAVCGLAASFVFLPNLGHFVNPAMTDGLGLLVLTVLAYSFIIDRYWWFASVGFIGLFARETTVLFLPVWGVRNRQRALVLVGVVMAALIVQRLLWPAIGGNSLVEVFQQITLRTLRSPSVFAIDVEASWGWALLAAPVGFLLLGREPSRLLWPVAAMLAMMVLITCLMGSTIFRLVAVLIPVVSITIGRLVDVLYQKKQYVWIALFAVLGTLQFCISTPTVFVGDRLMSFLLGLPIIKIGTVWVAGGAIALRSELAARLSQRDATVRL
jgi:hypothetical protein